MGDDGSARYGETGELEGGTSIIPGGRSRPLQELEPDQARHLTNRLIDWLRKEDNDG